MNVLIGAPVDLNEKVYQSHARNVGGSVTVRLFYVEHVALVLVLDMEKTNVGLDGPGLQPFNVPGSVTESEFSGLCDLVQIATLRLVGSDKWGNDCFALTSP